MKTKTKWILGSIIGLLVVTGIAYAVFISAIGNYDQECWGGCITQECHDACATTCVSQMYFFMGCDDGKDCEWNWNWIFDCAECEAGGQCWFEGQCDPEC